MTFEIMQTVAIALIFYFFCVKNAEGVHSLSDAIVKMANVDRVLLSKSAYLSAQIEFTFTRMKITEYRIKVLEFQYLEGASKPDREELRVLKEKLEQHLVEIAKMKELHNNAFETLNQYTDEEE